MTLCEYKYWPSQHPAWSSRPHSWHSPGVAAYLDFIPDPSLVSSTGTSSAPTPWPTWAAAPRVGRAAAATSSHPVILRPGMRHSSEQPQSPCVDRQTDTERALSHADLAQAGYDYTMAPRLVPQEGNSLGGASHETTGLPLKLEGGTF